jgi:cell division septal protein FtsQ
MVWQPGRRKKRLDYHQKNFHNPYFNRNSEKSKRSFSFKLPRVSFKFIFRSLLAIGLVYGLFWFVAKSSFFALKTIDVAVPLKFSADEVRALAQQEAGNTRYGLSEDNLLFFDAKNLSNALAQRYPVNNLVVRKIYPNKLFISFEEKIYEAVWLEAGKYYLINKDDQSAVPINLDALKDKKFPLIKYVGPGELYNSGFICSTSPKVRFIVNIFANISKNIVYKVDYFSINEVEAGPVELKIVNGPRVIFSEREDLDKQLKKLYTIVNDKLKADFLKKSYIDVRFGDTVYIK